MSQSSKPVYDIKTIASTTTRAEWEGVDVIAKHLSNGYIVLWQHHAIFTGVIENGKICWLNESQPVEDDSHILRLRAFNEIREYHFWRSGGQIKGRLRADVDGGNKSEVIDTKMKLRSVIGKALPQAHAHLVSSDWAVLTRNYIGYDKDTHQAGYVDSRFLDFEPINPNKS